MWWKWLFQLFHNTIMCHNKEENICCYFLFISTIKGGIFTQLFFINESLLLLCLANSKNKMFIKIVHRPSVIYCKASVAILQLCVRNRKKDKSLTVFSLSNLSFVFELKFKNGASALQVWHHWSQNTIDSLMCHNQAWKTRFKTVKGLVHF